MGMFDTYIFDPPLQCPVCGTSLSHLQGKDGPCLLLTWKQGHRHPIKHDLPDECVEDEREFLESCALPDFFTLYSYDCKCERQPLEIYGFCENGVWVRSEFVTHLNWCPGPQHNANDERKIKRDLKQWLESKVT